MPTNGLSLVGFTDPAFAINYLQNSCVPTNVAHPALHAEWATAQGLLGAPIPNAGQPVIQAIPATHSNYIGILRTQPHVNQVLARFPTSTFQLVEIDTLLAYQLHIDLDRSQHHCGGLTNPPTLDELLNVCLPIAPVTEAISFQVQPQSAIIKARSLNVMMVESGALGADTLGIKFGVSFPFVHVVRYNGRCYLHNGFHRVLGARNAGATAVPCLFRDVASPAEIVLAPPETFDLNLLESANPPTVGHYTQARAYPVRLRAMSRVMHISWAQYVVPDE